MIFTIHFGWKIHLFVVQHLHGDFWKLLSHEIKGFFKDPGTWSLEQQKTTNPDVMVHVRFWGFEGCSIQWIFVGSRKRWVVGGIVHPPIGRKNTATYISQL